MSRASTLLIILLLSLIIGYGVYDFYRTHEYKELTIHSGLLNEARRNPFYASRLFLKRMGIPTVKKDNLQNLGGTGFPDTGTVMMITSGRATLSTKRTEALLDWVKSGGHLIARSTTDWYYSGDDKEENKLNKLLSEKHSRDPLQRLMGIRTGKRIYLKDEGIFDNYDNYDNNDNNDNNIIATLIETEEDKHVEHEIKLKSIAKPLKIQSERYHPLLLDKQHEGQSEQVKLKTGNFIIRQKLGNGMVTLLADMEFIENYEIEKSDHAEILWHLVHGLQSPRNRAGLQQPREVWLIHSDKMASLWRLLWNNAWALIVSLSLLFFIWMLKATRRFGPLIPKQQDDRRSLNEHISSSGNFYWKNNKKQLLINSSRQTLTQRLIAVHPGWPQRSKEEQLQLLSEQLKMPSQTINRLLYDNNFEQADDFTWLIQQLEKIRKSI